MINKENLRIYTSIHNEVMEKIEEIVDLYGEIDNKYVDRIDSFLFRDDNFVVDVIFFTYGDDKYDVIEIPLDLITNESRFENLKNRADEVKKERQKSNELRERDRIEAKLKEAQEFIAKYGGLNNEK